jgi:glycosyltransferase involved in cell wall biosynthesis
MTYRYIWSKVTNSTLNNLLLDFFMPKKILLLSRKDTKHPKAGGAEVVIHRYAQWLVEAGYEVTQIAPLFSWARQEEQIDGIYIKRMFSIHTIYFCFWARYLFKNKERYDCIIDHAWGIPLLSPVYIRKTPIIFFTHHLGTTERADYFRQRCNLPQLWKVLWYIYTYMVLSLYRHKHTITVSEGTAHELRKLWFTSIHVLPNSTDYPKNNKPKAKKELILTTVGRIVPNKQFAHTLHILKKLHDNNAYYSLYIVGAQQDTSEVDLLQQLVYTYWLEQYVHFTGKVTTDQLIGLRDRTRYGIITSDKEWFGMTVLEANCRGVPMIWYAIPGVNEVIHPWKNGYLAPKNDRPTLVTYILKESEEDYAHLVKNTKMWIDAYPTWEKNSDVFVALLQKQIQ